jgi:hypothetical protein
MADPITIEFGALVKPIRDQLCDQAVTISKKSADRFEKIAHSITMLYLNGMITESVRDNARKKLMKEISNEIHKVTK